MASDSSESHSHSIHSIDASPKPDLSRAETAGSFEKSPDDTSKLGLFLGILRKFIGAADIATVRFSLPAQLLEPIPNLEYWNYLDEPSTFISIGTSDDPLDRMLEILRFWFTKDLKYVKGKPCKPYNSTLGEFFRCNFEVEDVLPPISELKASALRSRSSSRSKLSRHSSTSTIPKSVIRAGSSGQVKVSYLTEQTSHHPPVSAFYVVCPERGLVACGYDQITAKFTGMSIKVSPGEHNRGIFIKLTKRDNEEYRLTHPVAHIGGLLRGSINVTVGENCYVTCSKTKIKTILHYQEDSWLGKSQNKVDGVVFNYDPNNDNISNIKDVPENDILARISGAWKETVYFSLGPRSKNRVPLIDLGPLIIAQKVVPPETYQLSNESRKRWASVTKAIYARHFSEATKLKLELEEEQRKIAKEQENSGLKWTPRFFINDVTPDGKPELSLAGQEVLNGLQSEQWDLKESLT